MGRLTILVKNSWEYDDADPIKELMEDPRGQIFMYHLRRDFERTNVVLDISQTDSGVQYEVCRVVLVNEDFDEPMLWLALWQYSVDANAVREGVEIGLATAMIDETNPKPVPCTQSDPQKLTEE